MKPHIEDRLRLLNPFAVTFRYDDVEIAPVMQGDADSLVIEVWEWAQQAVESVTEEDGIARTDED